MKKDAIAIYRREINELIAVSKKQQDDEVKSYLSKLLIVRISGFLEMSLRSYLTDYVNKKGSAQVITFAENHIKLLLNASTDKICEILGKFSKEWRECAENVFADNDDLKEAINSIVGQRHKIAHGGSGGLGINSCEEYWETIDSGINKIQAIIK